MAAAEVAAIFIFSSIGDSIVNSIVGSIENSIGYSIVNSIVNSGKIQLKLNKEIRKID